MEHVMTINTMEEYISELTDRFGFMHAEKGNEVVLKVPANLGTGYMKMINVSDDVGIGVMDVCLSTPLVSYYESYDNTCEINYCLSGHIDFSETGVPNASLGKNEIGISAIPHSRGMMMIPSGERVHLVSVVSGLPFHRRLPHVEQCEQFDDPMVQDLLCRMTKPVKATAKMHNHFSQIMDNEMSGMLHNTYLDALGKVMLAGVWQESIVAPLSGMERSEMGSFEQRALRNARDILTTKYLTPPTTQALARMVALNEFSLKTGFKQLFGKSVYEYVRSLRMENARHLLENDAMSIGQVAAMVGYTNASHFARAFRSEYGINPKDFRFGS